MIISNKLFLIATLGLGLGSLNTICADYNLKQDQNIFDFITTMSKQEDAEVKAIAEWLTEEINNEHFDKHKVTLIINSPLTFEEKIVSLNAMYLKKTQSNLIEQNTIKSNNTNSAITKGLRFAIIMSLASIAWPIIVVISTKLNPNLIEFYLTYYSQMTSYLLQQLRLRK